MLKVPERYSWIRIKIAHEKLWCVVLVGDSSTLSTHLGTLSDVDRSRPEGLVL